MVLITPVAGTVMLDKSKIVKTVYKCMLVLDTSTQESVGEKNE